VTKPKRALVSAPLVPEFDRESGSQRLFDLMTFLQEAGWSVTFLAKYRGPSQRYVSALEQRGIPVYVGFNKQTEAMVVANNFDLAVLAFWEVAEAWMGTIRKVSPSTRIIVDSIDLHFLRNARKIFQQQEGRERLSMLDSEYAADMIREMNVYAASDGVLAVSEKEAGLINDLTGDASLAYLVPDCEDLQPSNVPFADRRGIVFVGNFRHLPNRDAVTYLCNMILPQLDKHLTIDHPVFLVGNGVNNAVQLHNNTMSHVIPVGWVPSVVPYLDQARVAVLPLLYGAGTKRKLVQALTIGTPTVSTSVGIEGLTLHDGEHVLVADDPTTFARALTRLLEDSDLWQKIATQGRAHIGASHGREAARAAFMQAVDDTFRKRPKPPDLAYRLRLHRRGFNRPYDQLTYGVQESVSQALPLSAIIAVISKGDEDLVDLGGRKAWHFPRGADGQYAGHYPSDSEEAIAHLEELRAHGADFLVVPNTAYWWFDHYAQFKHHLDRSYQSTAAQNGSCIIFSLRDSPEAVEENERTVPESSAVPVMGSEVAVGAASRGGLPDAHIDIPPPAQLVREDPPTPVGAPPSLPRDLGFQRDGSAAPSDHDDVTSHAQDSQRDRDPSRAEGTAPSIAHRDVVAALIHTAPRINALVVGIYLANRSNHVEHIVSTLEHSERATVTQRWVSLGGQPPSAPVAAVTMKSISDRTPKYQLLNDLLAEEDLNAYDYVLTIDDDILLPEDFADYFLTLQHELDFRIAQPARTSGSYIDLPIVEQQRGTIARQTLLVEIGPLTSFHASVYPLVFPFDLTSSMGWGYENVWSYQLASRGEKMGIIDCVPVDHSLRKPVENYAWSEADAARTAYLRRNDHFSLDKCFQVLNVITPDSAVT
jgi:hypothetical protein